MSRSNDREKQARRELRKAVESLADVAGDLAAVSEERRLLRMAQKMERDADQARPARRDSRKNWKKRHR